MNTELSDAVVVILHNLGPYHIARINVLKKMLRGLHIIELASKVGMRDWSRPNCSGFRLTTLFDGDYFEANTSSLSSQVKVELDRIQPRCIIVASYVHPTMQAALKWAKKRDVGTILFSESQRCDRVRYILRETFKVIWLKRYVTCTFASGARAANYFESLGFPGHRIWRGYSVVDNAWFSEQAKVNGGSDSVIRDSLQLPKKYFLYVGRFSKEKNLQRLLKAYKKYSDHTGKDAWGLVMVGSGPQEDVLKQTANILKLKDVVWPGFKQYDELPLYYSLASAFVLPSLREPWGLVVNEAMASSLPVLVSSQCGCIQDLVSPGINGWIIDPSSEDNITVAMSRMTSDKTDQEKLGLASANIVGNYTLETWSASLVDCVSSII